jgi:hypothetical protein
VLTPKIEKVFWVEYRKLPMGRGLNILPEIQIKCKKLPRGIEPFSWGSTQPKIKGWVTNSVPKRETPKRIV